MKPLQPIVPLHTDKPGRLREMAGRSGTLREDATSATGGFVTNTNVTIQ